MRAVGDEEVAEVIKMMRIALPQAHFGPGETASAIEVVTRLSASCSAACGEVEALEATAQCDANEKALLYSDAMDAATGAFFQTKTGYQRNADRVGEDLDGEWLMRVSVRSAILAYLEEVKRDPRDEISRTKSARRALAGSAT